MKKIIKGLSICFIAIIYLTGCTNKAKKAGARMIINKRSILSERGTLKLDDFSEFQQKVIIEIYRGNKVCASDITVGCDGIKKDCSVNYCGDTQCTGKIMCCHEIDTAKIYALTDSMRNNYAVFPGDTVKYVVEGADCRTQYIKLSVSEDRMTYYMESLNDTTKGKVYCKSFYSVALMQGILAKGVDSINVYEGVDVKGTKVVPFIVYYKGGAKFYDVSNDMP